MFKEKWKSLELRYKILIISAILLLISIPLVIFFRTVIFFALIFFIGIISYNIYSLISDSNVINEKNEENNNGKENDTFFNLVKKTMKQVLIIILCFGIPALLLSLIRFAWIIFI